MTPSDTKSPLGQAALVIGWRISRTAITAGPEVASACRSEGCTATVAVRMVWSTKVTRPPASRRLCSVAGEVLVRRTSTSSRPVAVSSGAPGPSLDVVTGPEPPLGLGSPAARLWSAGVRIWSFSWAIEPTGSSAAHPVAGSNPTARGAASSHDAGRVHRAIAPPWPARRQRLA